MVCGYYDVCTEMVCDKIYFGVVFIYVYIGVLYRLRILYILLRLFWRLFFFMADIFMFNLIIW